MRKYLPMFDLETWCVIRDYRKKALSSDVKDFEFNPRPFLQRFALNTTLTLCYGIRMDDAYDELLREILCMLFHLTMLTTDVGSAISLLRSASENYQDYIPVEPFCGYLTTDYALLPRQREEQKRSRTSRTKGQISQLPP